MRQTRLPRFLQGFGVHEGNHQHIARAGVRNHGGKQPILIELGQELRAAFTRGDGFIVGRNGASPPGNYSLWLKCSCCTITTSPRQNPSKG